MNLINMKKKIPVHIITGFLGSGKTTFLNQILEKHKNERIVVIENEIGKINIDGASIVSNISQKVELTAGCICCSLHDELFEVLEELYLKKNEIDRIFIETTGIADPGSIAATFLNHPAVIKDFELMQVISVIDALLIETWLSETDEAIRQIAASDLLLINKTDMLPDESKQLALKKLLKDLNPLASVACGTFGNFALDLTLSSHYTNNSEDKLQELSEAIDHKHGKITTYSFTFTESFNMAKLNFEINRLLFIHYKQIYRIKGLIAVAQSPVQILFQTVKNQINYRDVRLWEKDEPRISKLVVIGKGIQKENLLQFFHKCMEL